MPTLGLLGGTFDPIHLGHVAVGRAAQAALGLRDVRLVPSRVPPHRPGPQVSSHHRFAMAALTAMDQPGWTVSDVEVAREGPSYSYDTLQQIAAEGLAPTQICFLIGVDAFAEIATWSRYPAVLDLAHFVVVARPGASLAALESRVPAIAGRLTEASALQTRPTPGVVRLEVTTPDVSSTDLRTRAARGLPLDGLVPEAVAQYIRRHGLYARTPRATTP